MIHKIPYRDDFLINLKANSYSSKTIKNYDRDLAYFEAFLEYSNIEFASLKKIQITLFKSILKSEEHHKLLPLVDKYWDMAVSKRKTQETNVEISNEKGINTQTVQNDLVKQPYRAESQIGDTLYDVSGTKDIKKSNFMYNESNGGTVAELSTSSVNRMLSALRSYIKFLEEFDHVPPISSDSIKLLKKEKKETQVAEYDELIKLIEYPSCYEKKPEIALRNRAILELLFSTGMRISELVRLNREQLTLGKNPDESAVQVSKIYITGKGKKQRFVYLTPRAKEHLIEYLNFREDKFEPLFVRYRNKDVQLNPRKNYRISIDYIQKKIVEYRRNLGIVVPTSAHSLRHGFATYLIEKGANSAAVQILLGHESLATTTRYVHASDKFAEKTHKEFHPTSTQE